MYVIGSYMASVSVTTTVKWCWFLKGVSGLIGILFHLAVIFKRAADTRGPERAALYGKLAWLSVLVWMGYPVIWLFSEGFASFSVSFEACAYAVLDHFQKVVMSFLLLSAHDTLGVGIGAPDTAFRQLV